MKEATNEDRIIRFIEAAHGRLAAFARENYQTYGRGAVLVAVPLAPDVNAALSTTMAYHPATQFERLFDELDDVERAFLGNAGLADAHVLIRMIETYDPMTQAVLVIRIQGQNPIIIKMKLERPFVDEPERLH
jgi:hypothetical protein